MVRDALIVFLKEIHEVLRDRRTLLLVFLVPMLASPALGVLVTKLSQNAAENAQRRAERESKAYALFGADQAPGLEEFISQRSGFRRSDVASVDDVAAAIAAHQIAFAIVATVESSRVDLELYYDDAPVFGRVDDRIKPVIEAYGDSLRTQRLSAVGVNDEATQRSVIDPVELHEHGLASARERIGERMGGILPYMLLIFCFSGALYPATDLVAGEKERGTLETLLLAPVSRTSLVLGKFGVVFVTGALSAVLGTASMGVWLLSGIGEVGSMMGGAVGDIRALDFVIIGLLFIPVAAVFASVLLGISAYAKSFKEAQSYASSAMLIVMVPAIVAMIPGIELDTTMALVPIANVALAIKEVVKGTIEMPSLLLIFASSLGLAAALLAGTVAWFSREQVLFRQ